ncbi:MAG: VTT domain-containing protein [Candidatus Woesearchaeota archaeon]|nr:MAG: VTT domain-containing protein [Candidatus Woesearchaeota archaeon]
MAFLESVLFFIALHSYIVSFLGGFIEGEAALLFLSVLSAYGLFSIWPVLIFCYLGSLASDVFWFFIGRSPLLSKIKKSPFIYSKYKKVSSVIDRATGANYFPVMILTKFLYGFRIPSAIYLSRNRIKFIRFLFYDLFALAIWVFVVGFVGWLAGTGFSTAVKTYHKIEFGLLLLVVVILVFYLSKFYFRKKLNPNHQSKTFIST